MAEPLGRSPAPLTRIGRYDLLTELRDDGFVSSAAARVRGVHVGSRLVELCKVDRRLSCEVEVQAAFLAEARAAARVRRPDFIAPTDTLVDGVDLYMAHELVHGVRLSELMQVAAAHGERIPASIAVRIALDVANSVAGLHASEGIGWGRPLVHGDICPQTILVHYKGASCVVHSGLSIATRRVGMGPSRNRRLPYKAPEQLRSGLNEAIAVEPAADVYACAVVLWELLTGASLFDAPTEAEMAEQIIHGAVPPLVVAGGGAAALAPAIARALATSADGRPADAGEWADWLERGAGSVAAAEEEVALFVDRLVGAELERRREIIGRRATELDEQAPPSWVVGSGAISSHVRRAPFSAPGWGPPSSGTRSVPGRLAGPPSSRAFSIRVPHAAAVPRSLPAHPQAPSSEWRSYLLWGLLGAGIAGLGAALLPVPRKLGFAAPSGEVSSTKETSGFGARAADSVAGAAGSSQSMLNGRTALSAPSSSAPGSAHSEPSKTIAPAAASRR